MNENGKPAETVTAGCVRTKLKDSEYAGYLSEWHWKGAVLQGSQHLMPTPVAIMGAISDQREGGQQGSCRGIRFARSNEQFFQVVLDAAIDDATAVWSVIKEDVACLSPSRGWPTEPTLISALTSSSMKWVFAHSSPGRVKLPSCRKTPGRWSVANKTGMTNQRKYFLLITGVTRHHVFARWIAWAAVGVGKVTNRILQLQFVEHFSQLANLRRRLVEDCVVSSR